MEQIILYFSATTDNTLPLKSWAEFAAACRPRSRSALARLGLDFWFDSDIIDSELVSRSEGPQ